MKLYRQRNPGHPHKHQESAIAWCDDFHDLDAAALAGLAPAARAAQTRARKALWLYADAMWDAAKASGLCPADIPEYNCIAALRDAALELYGTARQAQANAGEDEPDDDDPRPALPAMETW